MQLRALEKVSCFVIPATADAVHAETQSTGNRCRTAELLLEEQISVLSHFKEDNAVERLRIYCQRQVSCSESRGLWVSAQMQGKQHPRGHAN